MVAREILSMTNAMSDKSTKGQAGAGVAEYRGVVLPLGMTPVCVDDLARVFSDFEWDRLERADGELANTAHAAVVAFEIVRRHLGQRHP